jgi:putative ABC transport system ATP-binding protein
VNAPAEPIVSLRGVSKQYGDDEGQHVSAVRDVSLDVAPGEFVSIMGPSGSGKSTLLNLIAGLDVPTAGDVLVDGQRIRTLSARQLAMLRRKTVTLVFQFFNLLPTLTTKQNVAVPLLADGLPRRDISERVDRALASVSMSHRGEHYPSQLSGGEMQRVAIARALATDARIILADEPTGNLDSVRGEEILELLKQSTERGERTVIMATHDLRAAAYGDRLFTMRDGRIVDEVLGQRVVPKVTPLHR